MTDKVTSCVDAIHSLLMKSAGGRKSVFLTAEEYLPRSSLIIRNFNSNRYSISSPSTICCLNNMHLNQRRRYGGNTYGSYKVDTRCRKKTALCANDIPADIKRNLALHGCGGDASEQRRAAARSSPPGQSQVHAANRHWGR